MALSIEAELSWVRAFLLREGMLVLPVALAFLALPPFALTLALPRDLLTRPQTVAEMQALSAALPGWVAPAILLVGSVTMIGALAITALALTPRISVGEALGVALRRLPAWLGAALLIGFVTVVAVVALGVALVIVGLSQALLLVLIVVALTAVSLFLILLLPVVAHGQAGPLVAIRHGWATWRPVLARTAGAAALVWVVSWLVAFALGRALGAVLLLGALAIGQEETGRVVATLWLSLISALQWAFFYVFVAALYRSRLGASSGT